MLKSINILPLQTAFKLPCYSHPGDAGLDLYSCVKAELEPGEIKKIGCGFAIEIPDGYLGAIAPRSGLALHYGVTVLNSWGVIDSSYRGEVCVILINLGKKKVVLEKESKVAQLIILRCEKIEFSIDTHKLSSTDRGEDGFGSTGC